MSEIRVGPAGWSYQDWNKKVYPARRPQGFHEAEYLARYFSVIEINTSFYRPVWPEHAELWARRLEAHRSFEFTAKMYNGVTHEHRLDKNTVREVTEGLEPLAAAGKLGCVLLQFPWSFKFGPDSRDYIRRIRHAFSELPLVAEVRHASWDCDEALELFAEQGIGFCNIDQPRLANCLEPTDYVTSSIGYVRLHGRNYHNWFNSEASVAERYDYLYRQDQLKRWERRVESIAKRAVTTYVVTNNHFEGKAVVNALQLLAGLSAGPVDAPAGLADWYPELAAVTRSRPAQRSLFELPAVAENASGGSIAVAS